jgi:F-type H+-transporting ATPase subunit alpha
MEEQVATNFAAGQGLMDDVALEDIKRFESEMLETLRGGGVALKTIRESGKLEDDTAATLKEEITSFKTNLWKSGEAQAAAATTTTPGGTGGTESPAAA